MTELLKRPQLKLTKDLSAFMASHASKFTEAVKNGKDPAASLTACLMNRLDPNNKMSYFTSLEVDVLDNLLQSFYPDGHPSSKMFEADLGLSKSALTNFLKQIVDYIPKDANVLTPEVNRMVRIVAQECYIFFSLVYLANGFHKAMDIFDRNDVILKRTLQTEDGKEIENLAATYIALIEEVLEQARFNPETLSVACGRITNTVQNEVRTYTKLQAHLLEKLDHLAREIAEVETQREVTTWVDKAGFFNRLLKKKIKVTRKEALSEAELIEIFAAFLTQTQHAFRLIEVNFAKMLENTIGHKFFMGFKEATETNSASPSKAS